MLLDGGCIAVYECLPQACIFQPEAIIDAPAAKGWVGHSKSWIELSQWRARQSQWLGMYRKLWVHHSQQPGKCHGQYCGRVGNAWQME
jgi:hypothetical protein